mmetsp:Transcript_67471/g.106806  ORF Transcript_67471/g.106806 Transcript_67471/m.106806 type:complete len:98 (+) Transcript_67471:64-357(+)
MSKPMHGAGSMREALNKIEPPSPKQTLKATAKSLKWLMWIRVISAHLVSKSTPEVTTLTSFFQTIVLWLPTSDIQSISDEVADKGPPEKYHANRSDC